MAQLLLLHLLAAALAPWLAKVLRTKAFPVLALAPAVSFVWLVSVSNDVRAGRGTAMFQRRANLRLSPPAGRGFRPQGRNERSEAERG